MSRRCYRLFDDALDGARAAATFGAAAEAAIDLLGVRRKGACEIHGMAHVAIGQHVAGTDNHWGKKPSMMMQQYRPSLAEPSAGRSLIELSNNMSIGCHVLLAE